MEQKRFVLKIQCPDSVGVVATATMALVQLGLNTINVDQFTDHSTGGFFMRLVLEGDATNTSRDIELAAGAAKEQYKAKIEVFDLDKPPKVLVLSSKLPHCLAHILLRQALGILNIEIPAIVSNHNDVEEWANFYNIPFHHLPITPETKAQQEAQISKLIEENKIDYIVLARYMQILSPEFCEKYAGKIINIHHSFLPGFKGGNPYRQAYDRGVKVIGATAHFVTEVLDEGQIIWQETKHVTHVNSSKELTRIGLDIEQAVLTSALQAVAEKKVFINGSKTVVFP